MERKGKLDTSVQSRLRLTTLATISLEMQQRKLILPGIGTSHLIRESLQFLEDILVENGAKLVQSTDEAIGILEGHGIMELSGDISAHRARYRNMADESNREELFGLNKTQMKYNKLIKNQWGKETFEKALEQSSLEQNPTNENPNERINPDDLIKKQQIRDKELLEMKKELKDHINET